MLKNCLPLDAPEVSAKKTQNTFLWWFRKYFIPCCSSVAQKNKGHKSLSKVFKSEIKEGPTYESGIALSSNENCLEVIPDNTSLPCITSNPKPNCTFLYFDLETTGFGKLFNNYFKIY